MCIEIHYQLNPAIKRAVGRQTEKAGYFALPSTLNLLENIFEIIGIITHSNLIMFQNMSKNLKKHKDSFWNSWLLD